jgi:hypothetical protein
MPTYEYRPDDNELEALRNTESLLDNAFAARAASFVAAGDNLVCAIGAFRGLSSVFDGLPAALSNDELRAGAATLEEVVHDCAAIHDLVPDQIGAMDELYAANANIGKRLDQLRDQIKIVACIAINARIEASALSSNNQDMLTFTYDVAKLAATAESTIDQYSQEQRKAHVVLQAASDVLMEFSASHRAQLGSIADEVRRSLASVEARRTEIVQEAGRIGERSRQITASIGKIITALQIADISSQRFAHVHESVTLLIEGLSGGDGTEGKDWWAGLTAGERMAVAGQVAMLQVGQIDHGLADLASETKSIENEITKLAGDAVTMTEHATSLYGSGGDAGQSFLGELASRIDVAGHLLSDCGKAFGRVGELNASVGARFATLHTQAASLQGIVGIVGGVRLIGLNAHLKSDGLGHEGRTLSAISRELRSSADQITAHARDLIKAMDLTLAQFEKLKTRSGAIDTGRLHGLVDAMAGAIASFREGGGRLADALSALSNEGKIVCDSLEAACAAIMKRDDLESRLKSARDILARIGDAASGADLTPRAKTVTTSFFSDHYTMAAERNVHSEGAADGSVLGTNAIAQPADDDLESILF